MPKYSGVFLEEHRLGGRVCECRQPVGSGCRVVRGRIANLALSRRSVIVRQPSQAVITSQGRWMAR